MLSYTDDHRWSNTGETTITLADSYDSGKNGTRRLTRKIFDNHQTILLGVLNSKNQIWGCLKTNPNGIKLLQITFELGILISPPSKPTFQRSGRVPDILVIALISNLPTTLPHQVINELDSDHIPVITTLNEPLIMNQCTPKLITAPINWQTFRDKLNTNLSCTRQYKNPEDINTSIEYLTNTIKKSINQATIKNNKTINHPPADRESVFDKIEFQIQNENLNIVFLIVSV